MKSKILGLDPGLSTTGYGIIECGKCLDFGTISTNSKILLGERITKIVDRLRRTIREYKPEICVIETLFFRKESARSVIYSAHLRGAIFYLCYQEKLPIVEVTPAKVKQCLTGNGRASKQQIQFMVKRVFDIQDKINEHAGDALAVAYSLESLNRLKGFTSSKKIINYGQK